VSSGQSLPGEAAGDVGQVDPQPLGNSVNAASASTFWRSMMIPLAWPITSRVPAALPS
jgi:hypothetical protein